MNYFTHPIAILFYIVFVLCVVLPWLKKRAEKTETVTDDRILTYLQIILSEVARKIMGVKFLFLIVVVAALLQSCQASFGNIKMATDNEFMLKAENGQKKIEMLMSIKDDPAKFNEALDKADDILGRHID